MSWLAVDRGLYQQAIERCEDEVQRSIVQAGISYGLRDGAGFMTNVVDFAASLGYSVQDVEDALHRLHQMGIMMYAERPRNVVILQWGFVVPVHDVGIN